MHGIKLRRGKPTGGGDGGGFQEIIGTQKQRRSSAEATEAAQKQAILTTGEQMRTKGVAGPKRHPQRRPFQVKPNENKKVGF